jgi:hypothetical protein
LIDGQCFCIPDAQSSGNQSQRKRGEPATGSVINMYAVDACLKGCVQSLIFGSSTCYSVIEQAPFFSDRGIQNQISSSYE